MAYRIAIIGRPNVGKSTLFNRLVGRKIALVDNMPGLTRDRKEGKVKLSERDIVVVDTAGLEEGETASISNRMRIQSEAALYESDLALFIVDARAGVTPADEMFAEIARRSGKPLILVANKIEGRVSEEGLYEAYSLGLGEPVALSAEHGRGVTDLMERVESELDNITPIDGDDGTLDDGSRPIRVAIVGRPNAGKSTLVNALLGEDRMITGPEAGLTRDSVAVDFVWNDRGLRLYDTAGLRKKAKVTGRAEQLSVGDALRSIRFAEVVILMVDADQPFEKQDLAIGGLVADEGRALVIAVNKWDLVEDKQARMKALRTHCETILPQVKGVPVVTISALSGSGFDKLMAAVFEIYELWNKRISTAKLNQFLIDAVDRHQPPASHGRRIKLRFMTQANARPPTFVIFCSQPDDLPRSYTRYLENELRKVFDWPGVPLRINMRKGKNPYKDS